MLVRNWRAFCIIAAIGNVPSYIFWVIERVTKNHWFEVPWLLLSTLGVISAMASANIVARLYERLEIDWLRALISVLRVFWSGLGVTCVFLLAFFTPWIFVGAMAKSSGVFEFGNVVADVVGGILIAMGLIWYALLEAGVAYAFVAITVERCRARKAIGRTFEATFGRSDILKTTLFGFALLLVSYGGRYPFRALEIALSKTGHMAPVWYVIEAPVHVVTAALVNVLAAVYYFDVRVRREGIDLELSLQALKSV